MARTTHDGVCVRPCTELSQICEIRMRNKGHLDEGRSRQSTRAASSGSKSLDRVAGFGAGGTGYAKYWDL